MPKLDLNKPVQTRNGKKVRILCTDRKSKSDIYPIIVLILMADGVEATQRYRKDGTYLSVGSSGGHDLINVPTQYWVNIYPDDDNNIGRFWKNKQDADEFATSGRMACVPVTFTEGEGLE